MFLHKSSLHALSLRFFWLCAFVRPTWPGFGGFFPVPSWCLPVTLPGLFLALLGLGICPDFPLPEGRPVPRTRFAPVKKCDDLLSLRSDAYVITED